MNRLKSLGIIGGAGPEAGALLFRQVVRMCQKEHHCQRDCDFPLIHLISYPFTEMLEGKINGTEILSEVKSVYNLLNTDFIVIACNTLHIFLDDTFQPPRFIHLIHETANLLRENSIVLCSSTSKKKQVHKRFFSCDYPENALQQEVDAVIDSILEKGSEEVTRTRLIRIIKKCDHKNVVLGCTELSLVHDESPLHVEGVSVIDPSSVAARKICESIFSEKKASASDRA